LSPRVTPAAVALVEGPAFWSAGKPNAAVCVRGAPGLRPGGSCLAKSHPCGMARHVPVLGGQPRKTVVE
jgi:hypothetical protein